LSLSRLLNPGNEIFVYGAEMRARRDLADRLQSTADQLLSKWSGPGRKIIGMICHVITPAIDEGVGLWMMVQQTNVHGFAGRGTFDDKAFRSVYGALETIWY